jgi:hypothetical protein
VSAGLAIGGGSSGITQDADTSELHAAAYDRTARLKRFLEYTARLRGSFDRYGSGIARDASQVLLVTTLPMAFRHISTIRLSIKHEQSEDHNQVLLLLGLDWNVGTYMYLPGY